MTEEYVGELFSRILKLNYTNHIYVKKALKNAGLCAVALICGYFLHFLFGSEQEKINEVLYAHFCYFFGSGATPVDCLRSAVYYAMHDVIPITVMMFSGYTMLSGICTKAILLLYSAELGFCSAFVYDFLIAEPKISGGIGAFSLFALCKLSAITALIFSAVRSEDFSYKFSEIFGRARHPLTEEKSREYLKTMISTAGYTAILNSIYLVFQSLSNLVPL